MNNNNITSKDGFNIKGFGNLVQSNFFNLANKSTYAGVWVNSATADHNIVRYNNATNSASSVVIWNGDNNTVDGNYFYNSSKMYTFIAVLNLASNTTIKNNRLYIADRGIHIGNTTGFTVSNNTVVNMTTGEDAWRLGISIERDSNNGLVSNNYVDDAGTAGFLVRKSNNVTFSNNYCDLHSINTYSNNVASDGYYRACYDIVEIYLGYLGDGTENYLNDNVTKIGLYKSSNITLSNTTYGANVQTYVVTQGVTNFVNDVTSAWNVSFNYPFGFADTLNFYNNNAFNELTTAIPSSVTNVLMLMYGIISNNSYLQTNYTISKTNLTFRNANTRSLNQTLQLFSLKYPYNDIKVNGALNSSNRGDANFTLTPNSVVEVGNFTTLSWLVNIPPSPNTSQVLPYGSNVILNATVTDPDGIYQYTGYSIYNKYYLLAYYQNSTSASSQNTFTTVADGEYYHKVFIHTSEGTFESPFIYFTKFVSVATGTQCNTSESALWALMLLAIIIGLVYFGYNGFLGGNVKDIVLFITLFIVLVAISGQMINVLRGLC